MKILIASDNDITRYDLPIKVEEVTLIKYLDKENDMESTLSFEAENGKWTLRSTNSVSIKQGQMILPSVVLEDYGCYFLEFNGISGIKKLFAIPSLDVNVYNLSFTTLSQITIGSSSNSNIYYNDQLVNATHAVIQKVNELWMINSVDNSEVYLNDIRINTSNLKLGDIIFINGLKIIWMGNYIRINNPNNKVLVNGLVAFNDNVCDNTAYTPLSDNDINISLYKDEDYFFHTPRLISALEQEEVEIDSPPGSEIREELPFLLTLGTSFTMAASSLMMGYTIISGVSNGRSIVNYIPQIVMCITMIASSVILPRVTSFYQKRKQKQREKERQEKYSAYLADKESKINIIMKKQIQIMNENNKSLKDCYDMIMQGTRNVWEREINDNDFLKIRLGIGSCPALLKIKAPEEHFTLDEDNLKEKVYEVVNKSRTLTNVPITLSLTEKNIIAIICQCSYYRSFLDGIVLQLMALHSGIDLKIVLITNNRNKDNWNYIKKLPHIWSDDREIRFFATNQNETKTVLNYLNEEYKNRVDLKKNNKEEQKKINDYHDFSSYYVILTDNYKAIKDSEFVNNILHAESNLGFSLLIIEKAMKNLPAECETFVQLEEKESCVLEREVSSDSQKRFIAEYNPTIPMDELSIKLANIPLSVKDADSTLPSSLSFLDMFNVSKIEQLNILNRWQSNTPVSTLATTIGVHANGEEFKLDLHEKNHGPHGLIAGSTGSGKSEFIITYILSMALNYHPYEVQFVLIDYKGGGLAGAFENKELGTRIPHLVGTITNLDTSEMNRTLVSIESEMKRRQKKFNEVRDQLGEGTIDIYKYQRLYREGVISEPMAHLFIISDEFAELKQQQPDFMQQLISAARIGRSLGIHLILATQKPAGVVNDQIWSNSKFKVCLKVQDRSDSMEMLKRPEAASIKEAGRFYLQVGYDDYFDIGQSGWSGAKYVPSDVIVKKVDDSINFVDNVGNRIKSINDIVKKEATEELGDQLTNLVKYINTLAKKENIETTKLWLDAIPEIIYIDDIVNKYNYKPTSYVISPVIGEYDNPREQEQGLLDLPLSKGNALIYGQTGSGKENLLATILWSSITEHTPSEVNFYIIDCGAESLKMFHKVPHVGEVITLDEPNKMIDLFAMVEQELDNRRNLFADYGGSYTNYIENSGEKLPLIVIIINNYDVFQENFAQFAEGIQGYIRDGFKYGIDFIVTATTTLAIRSRMAQNFYSKISLQLPNDQDYRNVLPAPKGLFPAKFFGRGLVAKDDTAYEFQTAYICDKKNITMAVKNKTQELEDMYTERARKIPSVPPVVTLDLVTDAVNGLSQIPIGYDMNNKSVYSYDFISNKFNTILAETIEEKLSFVYGLIELFEQVEGVEIHVIDFIKAMKKEMGNIIFQNDDFENALIKMNNEIMQENNMDLKKVYILLGLGNIKNVASTGARQILNNIFLQEQRIENITFIIVDSYSLYKNLQLETWYQQLIDSSNGIWLGDNVASQMAISITNLTVDDRKISFPDMAVAVKGGKHVFIKHITDVRGELLDEE